MAAPKTHVTWGKWSVSTTTPGHNGEPCTLSVFIMRDQLSNELGGRGRFQRGQADGMVFNSSDEAFAYALEHGYCQEYFTHPDLRARRKASGYFGTWPSPLAR